MRSTEGPNSHKDDKKTPASKPPDPPAVDPVDEASRESFPASDPPALDPPREKKKEKSARAASN